VAYSSPLGGIEKMEDFKIRFDDADYDDEDDDNFEDNYEDDDEDFEDDDDEE